MLCYEAVGRLSTFVLIDRTTSAIITVVPRTAAETAIQIELISSTASGTDLPSDEVIRTCRKRVRQDIFRRIHRAASSADARPCSSLQGEFALYKSWLSCSSHISAVLRDLEAVLEGHLLQEQKARKKQQPAVRVSGFEVDDVDAADLCDAVDNAARDMVDSCVATEELAGRLQW
jgi:hypothetical protein